MNPADEITFSEYRDESSSEVQVSSSDITFSEYQDEPSSERQTSSLDITFSEYRDDSSSEVEIPSFNGKESDFSGSNPEFDGSEPEQEPDPPVSNPKFHDPISATESDRLVLILDEPAESTLKSSWLPRALGLGLSLILHFMLIATLSWVIFNEYEPRDLDMIDTRLAEEPEMEPLTELPEYDLANPDDRELEVQKAINATSVGLQLTNKPQPVESASGSSNRLEVDLRFHDAPQFDIPKGLEVSKTVVVPGTTGEAFIQIETALDRVTWEIARNLQEKKLLVVWLIDASGSLTPQREIVAQRFRRIYGELNALEAVDQIPKADRPLLSGVVAFGSQTTFVTKEPTDKFEEVLSALNAAPTDVTGVENVFTAICQVIDRWQKYRIEQSRRILVIVVTDEAGDDYGLPLETAIAKCQHFNAKAYVIGPAAPFGRRKGVVPFVAKENGRTYELPVDLGPEAAVVENIDLPFWYDGPQYTYLSSGFGPYALTRLVKETGGVYFMTNMTTTSGLGTIGAFDASLMKAFEPDYRYSSPNQFMRDISKHPLRAAVVGAAEFSQNSKVHAQGTPQMEFRVQPNNFRQVFADAQKSAAVSSFVVENILSRMPPHVDKLYAAEPSLRWRLAFNLNYGRLLAQRIRSAEYNSALAQLKTSYTDVDISKRANHFILQPDRELHYVTNMKKQASTAEEHLKRVMNDAPGTPWALLAARELKDGFGLRLTERFIPPPPPAPPQKADTKPAKPGPKILPPPKVNVPQKPAPKPPDPVLPKL